MKYPIWESLPLCVFFGGLALAVSVTGCPGQNEAKAQSAGTPAVKVVDWEVLTPPPNAADAARAKVPGGWLIYTGGTREAAMIFLPDPEHKWLKAD